MDGFRTPERFSELNPAEPASDGANIPAGELPKVSPFGFSCTNRMIRRLPHFRTGIVKLCKGWGFPVAIRFGGVSAENPMRKKLLEQRRQEDFWTIVSVAKRERKMS